MTTHLPQNLLDLIDFVERYPNQRISMPREETAALRELFDSYTPGISATIAERARQDAKWGEQNHPDGTGPLVQPLVCPDPVYVADTARTLAEMFTYRTETHAAEGTATWLDILLEEVFETVAEEDPVKLRAELIQVAAVAIQWAEAIDRRASKEATDAEDQ